MKGNNMIVMCKSEMMAALEYYLRQAVMREGVEFTVTDISERTQQGVSSFEVKIAPAPIILRGDVELVKVE